jgi:hypothetical protein
MAHGAGGIFPSSAAEAFVGICLNSQRCSMKTLSIVLIAVCLAASGCENRTQSSALGPEGRTGTGFPVVESYDLRDTRTPKVGQVVRYEQYFEGTGGTLVKSRDVTRSSDDEYVEKEITETETTACHEGKASETKIRYLEDVKWEKNSFRGGDSTAKNREDSFKGEMLWGQRTVDGDWEYSLIGNAPNDAQRKRLRSMGKRSPEMYPSHRVKPGDKWTVDLRDFPEYAMKEGIELSEGKLEFKFERLVELTNERLGLNKERCAELKVTGKIQGKMFSGGDITLKLEGTGTIYRSLDKLLDVEEVTHINMKMEGASANDKVGAVQITGSRNGKETMLRTIK